MKISIEVPSQLAYGEDEAAPPIAHGFDVSDAAYHTAHNYPGGIAALAVRMRMVASTLDKKVNPNNDTHLLTLRESVALQEMTGDVAVLQAMAVTLGYTCVKAIPAASDDPLVVHWHLAAAMADLQHAVADAMTQGVSNNSLRRCNTIGADAMSAINNMLAVLRARLPAPRA